LALLLSAKKAFTFSHPARIVARGEIFLPVSFNVSLVIGAQVPRQGRIGTVGLEESPCDRYATRFSFTLPVLLVPSQRAMLSAWALPRAAGGLADRSEFDMEVERLSIEVRGFARRTEGPDRGLYLTVINVGLQNAQRFREKGPEAAWAEVEEARGLIREAFSEVRRWVRAMKPLALEERASPEAMAALARSGEGDAGNNATGRELALQSPPVT
jgi:hypothetical protein